MISHILFYFILGCFLGWCIEMLFKWVSGNRMSAGILNGPFCILYGVGVTFMAFFITPFQENIFLTFVLCAFFLTLFEYAVGVLVEKLYHIGLWDYTIMKFHINKLVCIEFTLVWGALGTIFVTYLFPILEKAFLILNTPTFSMLLLAFLFIIAFDFIYSNYTLLQKKDDKLVQE